MWSQRKVLKVAVFQQTTIPMLQLTQLYHAAASDLLLHAEQFGMQQQQPEMERSMLELAEDLPRVLIEVQLRLLMELVQQPPLDRALRPLYTSMEVPACALQLIVAASVDLHRIYRDMAAQQQQLKKKNKKRAAEAKVAVDPILLKLVVPADHEGLGVPTGWEEGIVSIYGNGRAAISCPANVCQIMEIAIRHHLVFSAEDASAVALQHSASTQSFVCGVGSMKLLLEAALLLQGTEPEAGIHHELQNLLHLMIRRAAREDMVVLLRERGELLMQAATLTAPEEWVAGVCSRPIPAKDRDRMRVIRGGDVQELKFDWMETLMVLADTIGELCWA